MGFLGKLFGRSKQQDEKKAIEFLASLSLLLTDVYQDFIKSQINQANSPFILGTDQGVDLSPIGIEYLAKNLPTTVVNAIENAQTNIIASANDIVKGASGILNPTLNEIISKVIQQEYLRRASEDNQISSRPTSKTTNNKPVPFSASVRLRSKPLAKLSQFDAQTTVQTKDFVDAVWNSQGKGISHQYEKYKKHNMKMVGDHTTELTWQQSGSDKLLEYDAAVSYVAQLNKKNFGGYNNWRLPTLEEAVSLIEPEVKNGNLSIDSLFDKTQRWIWTADICEKDSQAWAISFTQGGSCGSLSKRNPLSVRAVRSNY